MMRWKPNWCGCGRSWGWNEKCWKAVWHLGARLRLYSHSVAALLQVGSLEALGRYENCSQDFICRRFSLAFRLRH